MPTSHSQAFHRGSQMFNTASRILRRRASVAPAVAVALSALALAPVAGAASTTWFGSSLDHTPANAGSSCAEDGVGQPGDVCTHVDSDYPGFSGHAASTVNGTIVALKLRPAGPMTFTAEVVNVRNLSADLHSGQAQATAHS